MSVITFKKATLKDIGLILKIQRGDGFKHAYYLTSRRLKELFKRGEIFYIAYLGEDAAAFTALDIEKRVKIHFLSVMKKFSGQGIGSLLVEKIINEAKRRKKVMIYVYVEADSPLEKFLKANKFKKAGYFLNRFGRGKSANILYFSL